MPSPKLAIGQRLEVELVDRGMRLAATVVKAFHRKLWLELVSPPSPLTAGDRIRIFIPDAAAVFTMDTEIAESDPGEPQLPSIIGVVTTSMLPLQRRGFFRIPAGVPVSIAITHSATPALVGLRRASLTTFDLSGGGFRVETDMMPHIGDLLDAELTLPSGPLILRGRVARITASRRPGRRGFLVGIELLDAEPHQQAEIVRFIQSWERNHRLP